MNGTVGQVRFRALGEASASDLEAIFEHYHGLRDGVADQVLMLLRLLAGPRLGFPVDRLEHSLQSATRALRDGADDETVVCALLHDIGDDLAPDNHGALAAEILRPWISADSYWVLRYHNDFVGAHYFDKIGKDPAARDKHAGHPAFGKAARFCDLYDALAFDPDYDTLPLDVFEPMVRRVLSGTPWRHAEPETSH